MHRTIQFAMPPVIPSRQWRPNASTPAQSVNAMLIHLCVLRTLHQHLRALELSQEALAIAKQHQLYRHAAKAQLYRGLCLYDLKRYADARVCFIRAASIQWRHRVVTHCTKRADEESRKMANAIAGRLLGGGRPKEIVDVWE